MNKPFSLSKVLALYFFITICFFASMVYAQNYTLTGRFLDQNNIALELAKVSLYNNDTVLELEMFTDSSGYFSFHARTGIYTIKLRMFGLDTWQDTVELNTDIDLGEIVIDQTKILTEIQVFNDKPLWERKTDRLVFNVENSISASRGNLLDALKITPGVVVKQNSIELQGKTSVLIMIDDRVVHLSGESLMNYLSAISADNIKSIEVIMSPPARYDAQGKSGIINILYKTGRKNAWKNNVKLNYEQGYHPFMGLSNTFNYNKNKLSFDMGIYGGIGYRGDYIETITDYSTEMWKELSKGKRNRNNAFQYAKLIYELNEKHSIGAIIEFSQWQPKPAETTKNTEIKQDNYNLGRIHTLSEDVYNSNTNSYNINYLYKIDEEGKQLSADINYFLDRSIYQNIYNLRQIDNNEIPLLYTEYETKSLLNIDNFSTKIDMVHPNKWGVFSYGGKSSLTEIKSRANYFDHTNGFAQEDVIKQNEFLYNENILALYADVSKTLGEKWTLSLGFRYELTDVKGYSQQKKEINHNQYGQIFPTSYIMYQINENNAINVDYSRRIDRPYFWYLNPATEYIDAYNIKLGNPLLRPAYNDNVNISWMKDNLYIALYTGITTQGHNQAMQIDSVTKINTYKYENFYTQYFYGLQLNYIIKPTTWLESNISAFIHYNETTVNQDYNTIQAQNGVVGGGWISNNIFLNKQQTVFAEINYQLISPAKNLIFHVVNLSQKLDIAMRFSFAEAKLLLNVGATDIFKTDVVPIRVKANGVTKTHLQDHDSRTVYVSISYNFGNKNINGIVRETGSEDEQNRNKKQ